MMGLKDLIKKRKMEKKSENPCQPMFSCSKCKHELLLKMKYCDNCGGEIEWPEKYTPLIVCKTKK